MNRLLGLELLRGVAATLVLLEHTRHSVWGICGRDVELPWVIARFAGYWGVDVFFVLSGYLIGLTLSKPAVTPQSFLLARLARILPLYLVATSLCLMVPAMRSHAITTPILVTTVTFLPLLGDALDPRTVHPFGWTLCYEMGFYLVATSLTAAVGGRRAVGAMIALFALAPLAFTAAGPVPGWAFPNFALSPMVIEFALGLLAYRLTDAIPRRAGWALLALAAVGTAHGFATNREIFGYHGFVIADPRLGLARVTTWGLPAFACVLGTACLDRAGTFQPVARLATAVGALSYSLYLVQPCSLAVTAILCIVAGVESPWPVAAATVAVTFAIAAFVARYVDLPLHALARRWVSGAISYPRPVLGGPAVALPLALGSPPR